MSLNIKHNHGFSLIEVMVSLVLGLFVLAMIVNVFINTKQNHAQNARVTETLESGRYALRQLATDLQAAGFFGGITDLDKLSIDGVTLPDPALDCGLSSESAWAYDVQSYRSVQFKAASSGAEAAARHQCIDGSVFVNGTDVLAVKRVFNQEITSEAALIDKNVYLRSDYDSACLWFRNGGSLPGGSCPTADYVDWQYLTHIYYIRNFAVTAGDGIPTLCRKTLSGASGVPAMEDLCLAEGIEQFHVQFGIDTDKDGVANQFISDPADDDLRTKAVSARIFVLARAKREDPTFNNTKSYTLGDKVIDVNDNFYRRVYSTTVQLRNPKYYSLMNDV